MRALTRNAALFLVALAAGLLVAGCGSGASSVIKSLVPSGSAGAPSVSPPTASPRPVPTTQPSAVTPTVQPSAVTPTVQPSATQTAPAAPVTPSSSPTSRHEPRPAPAWLWWLIGAVVLIGLLVVILVVRSVIRGRSLATSRWRSRAIDAYAKGAALYDAMSFAERPGALAATDSATRWADIQRRADDLAQTLYAVREAAPNEDDRVRAVDVIASLQALRSAMGAERAPGGAGPQQAEVVRGRLFAFDAALRALRPADTGLA